MQTFFSSFFSFSFSLELCGRSVLQPLLDVWNLPGSLHEARKLRSGLQALGVLGGNQVDQLEEVELCPGETVPSKELASSFLQNLLQVGQVVRDGLLSNFLHFLGLHFLIFLEKCAIHGILHIIDPMYSA